MVTDHDANVFTGQISSLPTNSDFGLRKWVCSYKEVFEVGPKSELVRSTLEIESSKPIPERTLGSEWDTIDVKFQSTFNTQVRSWTCSGLLSLPSSISNPPMLISPLILLGKIMLQQLCRERIDGDEPIGETQQRSWDESLWSLQTLGTIKIPRCVRNLGSTDKGTQIRVFYDASEVG